ncbi:MAG: amidohydrolase family protein [Gammaproteobacteria bacterium]
MRIDVHTHYIPEVAIQKVRQGKGIDGIVAESQNGSEYLVHPSLGMRYPIKPEFSDRAAKLNHMDRLGIDISILSVVPLWLFHWSPAEIAQDFCREANNWLADFVSGSDRLIGMATVPLQAPDEAAKELRRATTDLGLQGVQIGTTVNGIPLDDKIFKPFFDTAEELGSTVSIHPCYSGKPPQFEDYYMKNLTGNPLATATAASRLILSGFLDRHPRLKVILVHAGGFMPYQIGRLDHGYKVRQEASAHIQKRPSEYLRRFYFDTITHAPAPLAFLVDLVGQDRVILGTDIPFDMADTDFSRIIEQAQLPPNTTTAIESGNAMELFNLD